MARIIYGVNGTGHGHAIRALTVARHFLHHEFLFLTWGDALPLLRPHYPVVECLNPETPMRRHRVDVAATLRSGLWALMHHRELLGRVRKAVDRFQPDMAVSDFELILPLVSRRAGLPCLAMNHQTVVTACRHPVPWRQLPSYWSTSFLIKLLNTRADEYLTISFYRPPLKPGWRVQLLPPLLRDLILQQTSVDGGHVLAFQGYSTFPRFFPFLSAIPRPVSVYGFNREESQGNLRFRKFSEEALAEDLASCSYVICGGGHTLMSEALYLGKPVLSFPVRHNFEQFLNAFYLKRLGYGDYLTTFKPDPGLIPPFEAKLPYFRGNIRQENFYGNPAIFRLLERFFSYGRLDA